MVPERLKDSLKIVAIHDEAEVTTVEADLTCCNSESFDIYFCGEIKKKAFSRVRMFPENDVILLEAHCKKCGKILTVFDSTRDGYEPDTKKKVFPEKQLFECDKCKKSDFSVNVVFEYPGKEELELLNLTHPDMSFTWVWATIKCNMCNKTYNNFLDYETS